MKSKASMVCPACGGTGELSWTEWGVDALGQAFHFTNGVYCARCQGRGHIRVEVSRKNKELRHA